MKLKENMPSCSRNTGRVYLNRQEEQDHPDEGTDIHDTGPADNESAAGYNAADPGYDFDLVTEAYNTLMGYEVKVEGSARHAGFFPEKFNLDEKKTDNFLHYYKYHILPGSLQ